MYSLRERLADDLSETYHYFRKNNKEDLLLGYALSLAYLINEYPDYGEIVLRESIALAKDIKIILLHLTDGILTSEAELDELYEGLLSKDGHEYMELLDKFVSGLHFYVVPTKVTLTQNNKYCMNILLNGSTGRVVRENIDMAHFYPADWFGYKK